MNSIKKMLKRITFSKKQASRRMGAIYQKQPMFHPIENKEQGDFRKRDLEQYFRPSCLPVLNTRISDFQFFNPYFEKTFHEIKFPPSMMDSPETTILNYFSILREAENLTSKQIGGCGTVGMARIPFPVAYNFFTKEYQKKVSYPAYLKSFEGIGHTNLIKLQAVPNKSILTYFFELETIEGSNKDLTFFAYYYGYISVMKEQNLYKIMDLKLYGEDFLCAAYHLWQHNAEAVVEIEYGQWCKMIKKQLPTKQAGYVKTIEIIGTDGNDYQFVFFQLTNDTDILISQFKGSLKESGKVFISIRKNV